MIVQAAYMNLEMSGFFANDCKMWRNSDPLLKTYAPVIAVFTECDLDWTRVTAASAGYNSANLAVVATVTELLNLKAQVEALERRLAQRPPTGQHDQHHATAPNTTVATVPRGLVTGGRVISYCSTHGCSSNSWHISATCNSKAEFHQDNATMDDKKWGSNYEYSAADARPQVRNGE